MLHALTDAEGLTVERNACELVFGIGHDKRLEGRHAGKRLQAESIGVRGHYSPSKYLQPLLFHNSGDGLFLLAGSCDVAIEERDARGIMPLFGELGIDGRTHELIRHAHQDAGTVAGVFLGAHCATMIEVDEHFDGVVHDLAFRALVEGGDHTHATSIVFSSRVIHTL